MSKKHVQVVGQGKEKVQIDVIYKLNYKNCPEALIKVYRPVSGDSISRRFVNFNEKLWGWGQLDNSTNPLSTDLNAETWSELKEKVEKLIDETIDQLQRVVNENDNLIEQKPNNTTYYFII